MPYTLWFSLLAIVGNIVMFVCFHFPIKGPFWVLQLASVGVVFAMQALGVLLLGVMPVMRDAISVGMVYSVLGISLSGFSYPVTSMLPAVQALCNIFPLRHYYMIYVHTALFGNGLVMYWPYVCALLAFLLLPAITHRRLTNAFLRMNYPIK